MIQVFGKIGKSLMKVKPIAKVALKASKNKPQLMGIAGGVAIIGSVIFAVKGGMRVQETMDDTAAVVEAIEAGRAQKMAIEGLSEEEKAEIIRQCNKDLKKARADGVWKMTKLFLLPGGLLLVGLALMGGGMKILKTRNVVLAGAVKGLEDKLQFYRENVIADQGKEADRKYMRGLTGETVEVEDIVKDPSTGVEKKVKSKVPVVRTTKNPWRFEFSENFFRSWQPNTESNLWFIKSIQDWCDHEFQEHGDDGFSMYEALKKLDFNFDVMKESMTKQEYRNWLTFVRNYGWKKGHGDSFIDFGMYRAINEPALLRKSDVIFVEFNCSGSLQEME